MLRWRWWARGPLLLALPTSTSRRSQQQVVAQVDQQQQAQQQVMLHTFLQQQVVGRMCWGLCQHATRMACCQSWATCWH
jgi:hypothetical protein